MSILCEGQGVTLQPLVSVGTLLLIIWVQVSQLEGPDSD
jgi:hypothetical protein